MTALDHGRSRRRGGLAAALALTAAIVAGCTDDPVAETLRLDFFPPSADDPRSADYAATEPPDASGYVELEAEVVIHRHIVPDGAARIQRRLNDRTEALMNGYDVWHLRFDRLHEPLADGAEWKRADRELTSYRRWALVGDPDAELQEFFASAPVRPSLVVQDNERRMPGQQRPPTQTVSLEFVFDGGTQATAGEAAAVERGLRRFAADVSRYQRRVAALWRHLNENPDRRFECLRALFGAARGQDLPESRLVAPPRDLAPSTTQPPRAVRSSRQPVLRDLEIALIERIVDAGEALLEILEVPEDDAFTLRELSRRVFDPFPAVLTAAPDGPVVEAVGFSESGDGWTIPPLDLWQAYRTLGSRFVSPDPLPFLLETDGDDFGCDDRDDACKDRERVSAFLERGVLVARPASSSRIRQVLEAELQPLDVYRLVWIRGGLDGETAE